MKKLWKKPFLETLDVSMTMKHHGDDGGEDSDGSDGGGENDNGLDS